MQHVVDHRPSHCRRCQHTLPAASGPLDPPPTWHQVAELPPIAAVVTEHRGHTRTCSHCGTQTQAVIPAAIRADIAGPRLRGCEPFDVRTGIAGSAQWCGRRNGGRTIVQNHDDVAGAA